MSDVLSDMLDLATSVMENAYSPYSRFNVGACIRTDKGDYYNGCNVENASYSLTICAERSAIAQMIAAGDTHIRDIVITSSGDETVYPCGACRQMIREFSDAQTHIHCCNKNGIQQSHTIDELLPHSFGSENLK